RRPSYGPVEPGPRRLGLALAQQHRGVIVLAAEIAALRRAAIPEGRSVEIGGRAPALLQATAHQVHRPYVALVGGAPIPGQRHLRIARHAAPVQMEVAEIVLGPGVASLGGRLEPAR